MSTRSLNAQRVVVCGGSSGIGLATARALLGQGALVTTVGRTPERLEATRVEGGEFTTVALDCADPQAVAEFFAARPPFDHIVVSMAANAALGPFATVTDEALRETFEGKFWPYVNVIRAAAAGHLAEQGSLTLVTGASAMAAAPGAASLAAVNGALEGMVKTLAVELAPRRVNAVSPGLTDTAAWQRVPAEIREDMYAKAAAETPAGRVGQPEDVAGAVVSCLANGFITGVVLPCDGGKRLT
jgi:NAD(P)-dependent dehydrogenase (short-subunit alcohol dehydrogenase family)